MFPAFYISVFISNFQYLRCDGATNEESFWLSYRVTISFTPNSGWGSRSSGCGGIKLQQGWWQGSWSEHGTEGRRVQGRLVRAACLEMPEAVNETIVGALELLHHVEKASLNPTWPLMSITQTNFSSIYSILNHDSTQKNVSLCIDAHDNNKPKIFSGQEFPCIPMLLMAQESSMVGFWPLLEVTVREWRALSEEHWVINCRIAEWNTFEGPFIWLITDWFQLLCLESR